MVRALVCPAPERLEYVERGDHPLSAGQVRIAAHYGAAKHGTEMSVYKGYGNSRGVYVEEQGLFRRESPSQPYPFPVGNMVVGVVTETGAGVTAFQVGDRALAYAPFATSAVANQQDAWRLPESLSWQSAVCLDPADFAFSAVRDGSVRLGDAVAVFSLGAIGLLVVQMLRLAGASPIIAVDPIEKRRKLAISLGADLQLDPTHCDAGQEIRRATSRRGADVVIDYSGTRQAMQDALRGVAFGGTVVLGAAPPAHTPGLDLGAEAHMNRPNIVFTRACSDPNRDHPRWDNRRVYESCFRLLADGRLHGDGIVWPVVDFDHLAQAYRVIADDPASTLKLGVRYQAANA